MQFRFIALVFVLVPIRLFCQTISGRIENVSGQKIPFANIIIKDSINGINIKEYTIARNGYYLISLKGKYQRVVLEVSANKYLKDYFAIDSPLVDKNYIHDFNLARDTIVKLKEVIVTAKMRSFQINGDTTSFSVSAYRDGTDRKIEDIIKKLPGIEVNEKTGEIKYKGKSVETVKLDGEDLFGSNYSIGTRNINADMIEQIQAIENYSDNPLLKGIEEGDKVALNLTLKKRKAEYSGDADLGLGILHPADVAFDESFNLLGISSRYKSFATISCNNIGINRTPFDYFSYNPDADQIKESAFVAKRVIPETYFDIDLDAQRYNKNNSFFSNYNSVFKIGKRLNIKTSLYYLSDKISVHQSNTANNFINGQEFLTSDIFNTRKKPFQYRGDIELKFNSSRNSLFEYTLHLGKEHINTLSSVLQNDSIHHNTDLRTHDENRKQSLVFTNKLTHNKALQVIVNQSGNNVPQLFNLNPAEYSPSIYVSNYQLSNFKKNVWDVQSVLLGKAAKNKYSITIGLNYDRNYFNSHLLGKNGSNIAAIDSFENNYTYSTLTVYNSANYQINLNRWSLTPAYSFSYLSQRLVNKISDANDRVENFIPEPSFSAGYRVNHYSSILGTLYYSQKPFAEDHFFTNPIFISVREVRSNAVELHLQKIKGFTLFYFINNLYRQLEVNAGIRLFDSRGNYFLNYFIQRDNTKTLLFFLPLSTRNFDANFLIQKYLPFLESTVRISTDYSVSDYKDIVNNSSLRENVSKFFSSEFFFKTALDIRVNFEYIFSCKQIRSISSNNLFFTNLTLGNNFKMIIQPGGKRMFLLLSADYFLPNAKKRGQNCLFLDGSLNYWSKKKTCEWRFTARNISNNTRFNQVETNDFSTINFQTNLLPRYFMMSVSRNF